MDLDEIFANISKEYAEAQEREEIRRLERERQQKGEPPAEALPRILWQPRANADKTCLHCGADIRRKGRRSKFCSIACYQAARPSQAGNANPNWKGGVSKDALRYKYRFQAKNPEKVAAHSAVYSAKRAGRLIPQPCETCGSERSHAHHEDYSKPLEVRWLCQKCHNREHRKGAKR